MIPPLLLPGCVPQVWNGSAFATVSAVARFVADQQRWLPLGASQLGCLGSSSSGDSGDGGDGGGDGGGGGSGTCTAGVKALAWDGRGQILFVGGSFDSLGRARMASPGLAYWRSGAGLGAGALRSFPMGTLERRGPPPPTRTAAAPGVAASAPGLAVAAPAVTVSHLAFDPMARTLFVAGNFDHVNGSACSGLAALRLLDGDTFPGEDSDDDDDDGGGRSGSGYGARSLTFRSASSRSGGEGGGDVRRAAAAVAARATAESFSAAARRLFDGGGGEERGGHDRSKDADGGLGGRLGGSTRSLWDGGGGGRWECIASSTGAHGMASVTALVFSPEARTLFVAGVPNSDSSWRAHAASANLDRAIARLYFRPRYQKPLAAAVAAEAAAGGAQHEGGGGPGQAARPPAPAPPPAVEYERAWEWLPSFAGANGDIHSLFFVPKAASEPAPAPHKGMGKSGKKNGRHRVDDRYNDNGRYGGRSRGGGFFARRRRRSLRSSAEEEEASSPLLAVAAPSAAALPVHLSPEVVDDRGLLLVAGSFTNYPAVAVWVNNGHAATGGGGGPATHAVLTDANPVVPGSGVGGITGHVTTITPMLIPRQAKPVVRARAL